jgi:hypothetical protein
MPPTGIAVMPLVSQIPLFLKGPWVVQIHADCWGERRPESASFLKQLAEDPAR